MSQDTAIKMQCPACHQLTYMTSKNKKTIKARLELAKYCKFCKKRTPHKETK